MVILLLPHEQIDTVLEVPVGLGLMGKLMPNATVVGGSFPLVRRSSSSGKRRGGRLPLLPILGHPQSTLQGPGQGGGQERGFSKARFSHCPVG